MEESIAGILNAYCQLILAIEDDSNFDPMWRRFYQIQMHMYLLSKKDFNFDLEDAEHVYDSIVNTWTDLKNYVENPIFPINNLDNIFKTTVIEFPLDDNTISDLYNNDSIVYGSN